MGNGKLVEIEKSRAWRKTLAFVFACEESEWDLDWIKSLFSLMEDLHRSDPYVRKKITKQCVSLLRSLSKE